MWDTWYDPAYQYYFGGRTHSGVSFRGDDKNERQFVCVDGENQVVGYLNYWVNDSANAVDGIGAINFDQTFRGKTIFGRDLLQLIDDIFMRDAFNRLQFAVIVGNPIEAMYDKYIEKYGGRIVGTYTESVLGPKGELCNEKVYEVLRTNYLAAKFRSRWSQ